MLLPACTGTGVPEFVTERSAESATWTVFEAVLLPGLGSVVTLLATEAVSAMTVPEATVGFTFTMKEKVAGVLIAMLAMLHVYGATAVHDHPPPGPLSETNVVFVGSVSVSVTVVAAAGPAFTTVCE
jgi:hypothetical protein